MKKKFVGVRVMRVKKIQYVYNNMLVFSCLDVLFVGLFTGGIWFLKQMFTGDRLGDSLAVVFIGGSPAIDDGCEPGFCVIGGSPAIVDRWGHVVCQKYHL